MKNALIAVALGSLPLMQGCGATRQVLKDGRLPQTLTHTSDSRYLRFLGVGVAAPDVVGDTMRKAQARIAALVQARFEAASFLKGVRLEGGLTVERAVAANSDIHASMDQVIAGAEEESVEFTADGGAVVVLRIKRSKVEEMLEMTAKAESSGVDTVSLEEQLRLAEARSREMRSKLSGMEE